MPTPSKSKNKRREHAEAQRKLASSLFEKHKGNISAVAREMGLTRITVRSHLAKAGLNKRPLSGGSVKEQLEVLKPPPKGRIRRFILTSAQNNTLVNRPMWEALKALAEHYGAGIMVGTFTYNQNAYGRLAVKRGTEKPKEDELWYDPVLEEHIVDRNVQLANSLMWCGRMNILPTAVNPLSGLETYAHRKSAIFPHAKVAMRSVPVMQGEWMKAMYTTGCVTLMNYIQKKEGIKAETHHSYSALLVEVDDNDSWWVRQLHSKRDSWEIQDLDVIAYPDGKVTAGNRVEAVTWGDLHATMAEESVIEANLKMLDALKPKFQFLHDVMEGASTNRHQVKNPNAHYAYWRWLRGLHRVEEEFFRTSAVIGKFDRDFCETIIPDSNHDAWWVWSWLNSYDYRKDPANARTFLRLQNWAYEQLGEGKMVRDIPLMGHVLREYGLKEDVRVLQPDESFLICGGKIECGMHGHLGPRGARGTPSNLSEVGRRANTAHTHEAGIYNGLYVAGTSSKLKWTYNWGPSAWSHSHIVTYPNGSRTIVTQYAGKWRA